MRSTLLLLPMMVACGSEQDVLPLADPGPARVGGVGQVFTFDASASAAETLRWELVQVPDGSALQSAALEDAETPWPSFTPDAEGEYVLELTACVAEACEVASTSAFVGEQGAELLETWLVAASGGWSFGGGSKLGPRGVNHAPVASAAATVSMSSSTVVFLSGTGSYDPDGDALKYRWSFYALPAGSALGSADISGRTRSAASFSPDVTGTYAPRLRVSDGQAAAAVVLPDVTVSMINDTDPLPD